jgi:hypothetical protein
MSNILFALAAATASYDRPEPKVTPSKPSKPRAKVVPSVNVTAEPLCAPSADGAKAPVVNDTAPRTVAIPALGSLSAEGFIEALRSAGKRQDATGKTITDHNMIRPDETLALYAYCGYQVKESHGTQLDNAKRRAQRSIKVAKGEVQAGKADDAPYARGVAPTMAGFVSGMPDELAKQIQDLLARERLTAETMAEHIRHARDEEKSDHERNAASGLAALEKARLNQIRKDLAALGS